MTTLNPGYYPNTACSPGGVSMPNSSQNPVTLAASCNPIDKALVNSIISYLISNDIFILNQQTDVQRPGAFNIYSYGQANSFLQKIFDLLDANGTSSATLRNRTISINSLGDYSGQSWITSGDYGISATNIILDGQIILPTDLPSDQIDTVLTIDGNGLVNETVQSNILTKIPTLQQVTAQGNSTDTTITQSPATNDYEVVTYGQMVNSIGELLLLNPQIIQIIIDYLETHDFTHYIPLSQKGVAGGVQTLDLTGKLTSTQTPQLTLQNICDNAHTTTTTLTASPATSNTELVTLGQVEQLLSQSVGTLDQVLTAGNISQLDINLVHRSISNTLSYDSIEITDTQKSITIASNSIIFSWVGTGYNNSVTLQTSNSTTVVDRLLMNGYHLLSTIDFGHEPQSTIAIDACLLDGHHASEFIFAEDFVVDVTGQVTDDVLVYNGSTWIPGTVSVGSSGLINFTESLVGTLATLTPTNSSNSIHIKTATNRNIILGIAGNLVSGNSNLLYTYGVISPTIRGHYNVAFLTQGTMSGDYNVVFGSSVNLQYGSTNNFIFESTSQIGTATGATYNIMLRNTTDATSTAIFSGSYSTLLQNTNLKFSSISIANNVFLQNNGTLSLQANDAIAIRTNTTTISSQYGTAINADYCTIGGLRSFVSGHYITTASYANAAFGVYGTVETGGTLSSVAARDRQFFVGSGTGPTQLKNAITIWKSGAAQLYGALVIGTATDNETGQIITGTVRQTGGYLEIYRGGSWQTQLSTFSYTPASPYYSVIEYTVGTASGHTISGSADLWNANYRIYPGVENGQSGKEQVTITDGVMTFLGSGVFNVQFNVALEITNTTAGDEFYLTARKTSSVNEDLTNCYFIIPVGTQATNRATFNFSITNYFAEDDNLALYIHAGTSVTHVVTTIEAGTQYSVLELVNAALPT